MEKKDEEVVSLFDEGEQKKISALEEDVITGAPAEFVVPDKFKGKSAEEVAESYVNLEKEYGNKANEVGELRKLTDQILQQQVQVKPDAELDSDIKEVGFDEIVENPSAAVNKVMENNPTLKRLEANLEKQEAEIAHRAVEERHSDVDAVIGSSEFQNWVVESPSRVRSFQRAHQELDADAASDMIDMYKATRKVATEQAVEERDAQAKAALKNAKVETGGAPSSTKKIYKRTELIRLKQTDPARYASMYDEIHLAYAEKRVK